MKCRVVSANLSRRNFSGESYIEVVLYARWDASKHGWVCLEYLDEKAITVIVLLYMRILQGGEDIYSEMAARQCYVTFNIRFNLL